MNVLIWHVHGSWTTSFVQGPHTYLIPTVPGRTGAGRGRARTWNWPAGAVEVSPEQLADTPVDVIVVQRCEDVELAGAWLGGRRPGRDVPLIWLEHNAPQGRIGEMRHPAADRADTVVVHVTHTNQLFWDTGSTRTRVIEHGVIDPGRRWTGEHPSIGVAVNEPVRRGRVVGADLLARFGTAGPVRVFGMGVDALHEHLGGPPWLTTCDDLPQHEMHDALAASRCYVHPFRWTSLGLSLIEAMMLGMPVISLATTDVPDAVGAEAGVVSNDIGRLVDAATRCLAHPDYGAALGDAARRRALDRYGIDRFLAEWNTVLEEV